MGSDLFGVLLTVLLLAANAFFVGAEFALISARRDRLEALAEQGKKSAVTVIRAGERLSLMLAGAQLGITICSILLGRVGEPAVAHLLEKPFGLLGIPDAVLHTVSFLIALARRGDPARAARRDGAEEHRHRRARVGGDAADPAVPGVHAAGQAVHRVLQLVRQHRRCASFGVEPKDELDITVSTVELSEMIAESLSEGLLDPEEHGRLTRALQMRTHVVADVAIPLADIRAVPVAGPGLGPDRRGDRTGAGRHRLLPLPRHRRHRDVHRLPAHQGRAVADGRSGRGRRPVDGARRCRGWPRRCRVPDALTRLRRDNSHLALVTTDDRVTAMVALEDLVEDLVGTVRDGTHRV